MLEVRCVLMFVGIADVVCGLLFFCCCGVVAVCGVALLFAVCNLLVGVCCWLLVICFWLVIAVGCLMFVVCCWCRCGGLMLRVVVAVAVVAMLLLLQEFGVYCMLCIVCYSLVVVRCSL